MHGTSGAKVRNGGFGMGHIQNGINVRTTGEHLAEICFIDHRAAQGVDEGCTLWHGAQERPQFSGKIGIYFGRGGQKAQPFIFIYSHLYRILTKSL